MKIQENIVDSIIDFLGEENLRWFKHLKGLTGTYAPVLKLNVKRKFIPTHPVHFREGMQIRNHLRSLPECSEWSDHDFDNHWTSVIDIAVKKQLKK